MFRALATLDTLDSDGLSIPKIRVAPLLGSRLNVAVERQFAQCPPTVDKFVEKQLGHNRDGSGRLIPLFTGKCCGCCWNMRQKLQASHVKLIDPPK